MIDFFPRVKLTNFTQGFGELAKGINNDADVFSFVGQNTLTTWVYENVFTIKSVPATTRHSVGQRENFFVLSVEGVEVVNEEIGVGRSNRQTVVS